MDIVPDLTLPSIVQSAQRPRRQSLEQLDHVIVALPSKPTVQDLGQLPQAKQIRSLLAKADAGDFVLTRLGNARGTGLTIGRFPGGTRFEQLAWARKLVAAATKERPTRFGLYAVGLGERETSAISALLAASLAAAFRLPSQKSKPAKHWSPSSIRLLGLRDSIELDRLQATALGNNLARWFTALPPNALTATSYRRALRSLAAEHDLKYEFIDEKKLERLGAGAFLAVSQGNEARDAGIVRLSYRAGRRNSARLSLVGKGILFDTGGTNLKPFKSMLDMHTDMQGSAVAVGTLLALTRLGVDYSVDAWLAITENRISATAYKSQDIVTAANGTTIQVIHTDAEGRMVLADTLTLATRENPAVVIDYATLTGACVGALTERYSGTFSNRPAANELLRAAGSASGERVWPFPMDSDFDEALRSDVADIKQCAVAGSGDHILAARFLSRFVPEKTPWMHVDLSAGQSKDGLAHIPSEITGFGVGLTLELLRQYPPAELAKALA